MSPGSCRIVMGEALKRMGQLAEAGFIKGAGRAIETPFSDDWAVTVTPKPGVIVVVATKGVVPLACERTSATIGVGAK